MDKLTLGTLIKTQVADALTHGDTVAASRKKALEYYRGDLFGDEQVEQSKYVSRVLSRTVDSILPGLMRVFFSGDMFGKFEPKGPEDEQGAKQATDLCNYVFQDQNRGFMVGQTAMKDSLLQKDGIVEVCWDATPEVTKERYVGLNDAELAVFEADENIEVSEKRSYPAPRAGMPPALASMGIPPGVPTAPMSGPAAPMLHDVVIRKINREGKCAVFNVPPEEFFIEKGAVSLDTALICGRQYLTTASELVEQGFSQDDIDNAGRSSGQENDSTGEKSSRFGEEEYNRDGETVDPSTRLILRTDAYLRVDWDEDGIAELRKVTCLGEGFQVSYAKVGDEERPAEPEEIDCYPFAVFQGMPSPHKFHGESMYDKIGDLQYLESTLMRQTLDNAYLTNQPRMFAQGDVDIEALLTVRPNGIVQGGANAVLTPLAVPFMAKESFPLIEMAKSEAEERSGVTRYNQGLEADTLNKTATGVSIIQTNSEQKQELIARNFAEGYAQVYRLILKFLCQHNLKPLAMRIRNQFVQMDPRSWKDTWDFTVSVGLGTGNKVQRAQQAMMLLQVQKELVIGGKSHMVDDTKVYNATVELIRALDMKPAESFINDPATVQPPQPQPSPEDKLIQGQLAIEQMKAQATVANNQQKAQLEAQTKGQDHQIKLVELQAEMQRDQEKWAIEKEKLLTELQIMREKAGIELQMKQVDMHAKQIGAEADMQMTHEKHGLAMEQAKAKGEQNGATPSKVKVKVAGGEDMGKVEAKMDGLTEALNSMAKALSDFSRPKRAVKRNGGWEQEYINSGTSPLGNA